MIISCIEKHYTTLTPTERKVAKTILSSPEKVTGMTVYDLAKRCDVAPSAVIRFCKSIKLRGFPELKIALARELGSQKEEETQMPAFDEGDGTAKVVRKVFCSGMQTLRDTLDMMDFQKVENMARALESAKRIFVFGIGTSSIIARDAQYRLAQLGLWASACTDILLMNVTAMKLGPEDVVLAVSHSGRTKAVVDAVHRAHKAGARTLAITSFANSLLDRESDISAVVYADELQYPIEAVSARVAHICMLDALTMVIATHNFESFSDHIKDRNKILQEIRYEPDTNII